MSKRLYRPSNGTEGMIFMEHFCDRCTKNVNDDCDILSRSFWNDVDDPDYPKKWLAEDGYKNPECTAFEAKP